MSIYVIFDECTLPFVLPTQTQANTDVSPHLATFVEFFSKLQAQDDINPGEEVLPTMLPTTEPASDDFVIPVPDQITHTTLMPIDDDSNTNFSDAGLDSGNLASPILSVSNPQGLNMTKNQQPGETISEPANSSVDAPLTLQGYHMITRYKAKTASQHYLSLVARKKRH